MAALIAAPSTAKPRLAAASPSTYSTMLATRVVDSATLYPPINARPASSSANCRNGSAAAKPRVSKLASLGDRRRNRRTGEVTQGMNDGKWVPSEMRLEFVWRILREHEGIVSGGKVNRLIDGLCGERMPTIHLANVDLS